MNYKKCRSAMVAISLLFLMVSVIPLVFLITSDHKNLVVETSAFVLLVFSLSFVILSSCIASYYNMKEEEKQRAILLHI